jgi:hypothetical protein
MCNLSSGDFVYGVEMDAKGVKRRGNFARYTTPRHSKAIIPVEHYRTLFKVSAIGQPAMNIETVT